jgi:hypothetical protein
MAEITIRNKELLKVLDGFVEDLYNTEGYDDEKYHVYSSEEDKLLGEYYCSDEFLEKCIERWKTEGDLIGAPDRHFAQPIAKMVRADMDKWGDYMQRVKYDFASELGAHTSALLSFYPPGGFVGWHTNWDANAYQVLFTWSKTGDGYFRYRDNETGKIVTEYDKAGWQARHYYFGNKHEEDLHCWHSAYAGCERITLAYKFVNGGDVNNPEDKSARALRDMLIEEIESE